MSNGAGAALYYAIIVNAIKASGVIGIFICSTGSKGERD